MTHCFLKNSIIIVFFFNFSSLLTLYFWQSIYLWELLFNKNKVNTLLLLLTIPLLFFWILFLFFLSIISTLFSIKNKKIKDFTSCNQSKKNLLNFSLSRLNRWIKIWKSRRLIKESITKDDSFLQKFKFFLQLINSISDLFVDLYYCCLFSNKFIK